MKTKYFNVINELRGLAAFVVFIFHFFVLSEGFFDAGIFDVVVPYGKYGVQLFFVISGFVITYSLLSGKYQIQNFLAFVKKRLIRLEPPYLIMLLIWIGFLAVRFFIREDNIGFSFNQVILHLGYLVPFSDQEWISVVFWTLAVEFQFYLLMGLLFPIILKNWIFKWLIFCTFPLLSFILRDFLIFYWFPVFVLGIQTCFIKLEKITKVETLITIAYFALSTLFLKYPIGAILIPLSTVVIIIYIKEFGSKFLFYLGNISYSLYLCHEFIFKVLLNIGLNRISGYGYKVAWGFVIIGSVILCSHLLWKYIEEPSRLFASRIKLR